MAGGIGQDFLNLIGSDDGVGDDFNELITTTPDRALEKKEDERDNRITESELDAIEEKNRPGPIKGAFQTFKSAGRELKQLGSAISGTVNYLTPVLKEAVLMQGLGMQPFIKNEKSATRKLAKDASVVIPELIKASPEIVGGLIEDFGRSFGTEVSDETGQLRIDRDVLSEKFRNAPIETVGDWLVVGAIAKKAVSLAGKGIAKSSGGIAAREAAEEAVDPRAVQKAFDGDKDFMLDVMAKMDDNDKAAAFSREIHRATKSPTPTVKDRLFDRRRAILSTSKADLENPEFVRKVGNRVKSNLERMERVEKAKLAGTLGKIGNQKVDPDLLFGKMSEDLRESLLLSKKHLARKGPFKEKIKRGFKDTTVENFLDEIDSNTTVRELNEIRKRLDEGINFGNEKAADKALKIARRNIDDYIKKLDGAEDYAKESERVRDRLQVFFDKQKKIKKAGGGEKFGKSFLQSHEEVDLLLDALNNSDSAIAQALRADIELLDGWHTWNKMWSMNKDLIPQFYAGTPLTLGLRAGNAVTPQLAKSAVRNQLRLGPVGKAIPSAGQALTGGAIGVSASDALQDIASPLQDQGQ